MINLQKRVCYIVMGAWLGLAAFFPVYATNADISDAKKKASSLEEEKKKVEDMLKGLEGLKSDTAAYVKQLDLNLDNLNKELNVLEWQIDNKEQQIQFTQVELERAKGVETGQYESMKKRIQYMYEKGDTNYLDLLMEAESFSQLLNRAEYVKQITAYDRRMLDQYIEVKEGVSEKEVAFQQEKAELMTLQESTSAKQASVEKLVQEKSAELKNYEKKIVSAENQITEYEKDIKAQEDTIKQIEAEIKRKEEEARKAAELAGKTYNTANIGNIKFIWPCPSSRRITSSFGDRESPTEGASSNHKGLDIGASSGSSIIAAAAGEVSISTYSYSAGNYIMINHGGGVYTVYMHCSQLLASVGDKVTQGQVIAKVGSTGYSTGPHLHFGIRAGGSYINPVNYVSP